MILQDNIGHRFNVILLLLQNVAYPQLLAALFQLQNQCPDYSVKKVCLDGASEFASKAFEEYCELQGIIHNQTIPHNHHMNGHAENAIKQVALIICPLMMQTNLPSSYWGYCTLNAISILQYRVLATHDILPYYFLNGHPLSIVHLHRFGCQV